MDWSVALAAVVGGLVTRGYLYFKDHVDRPVRWKCPEPGCRFSMTANNEKAVDVVRSSHLETFHGADEETS